LFVDLAQQYCHVILSLIPWGVSAPIPLLSW
jgi:hypothetical protein